MTNRDKSKRHYRVFMSIILAFCLGLGYFWFEDNRQNEKVTPVYQEPVAAAQTIEIGTPVPQLILEDDPLPSANSPLADQIAEATSKTSGTFGIAVKNLTTGETYMERATEPFTMASTYKIPLVLHSLLAIENGTLPKETKLGWLPILEANELIISRSEEDFAQILVGKIGWPSLQATARRFGMNSTDYINKFTTTPQDQITLLEKIYKGQGMSQTVRDQMYGMLSRQQINDRLPKYLPSDAIVAHKTGELDDLRHDVGIITVEGQTYVIALMSKELGTPEVGKEALAKISLLFYRYFTQKE